MSTINSTIRFSINMGAEMYLSVGYLCFTVKKNKDLSNILKWPLFCRGPCGYING